MKTRNTDGEDLHLTPTRKELEEAKKTSNIIGDKFHEGFILAKDPVTGLMYHLNRQLKPISKNRYPETRGFSEGVSATEVTRGRWAHVNEKEEPNYPERYDAVGDAHHGRAWARLGDEYFYINPHSGRRINPSTTWPVASDYAGGYARVKNSHDPKADSIWIDLTETIVMVEKLVRSKK